MSAGRWRARREGLCMSRSRERALTKADHAMARSAASAGRGNGLGLLLAVLSVGSAAPVRAEGILDAACTPGSKFIIKDYADKPANTQPRGHDMAAFVK